MTPRFFKDANAFRSWLKKNHATATELSVGLYNKTSGKGGITYSEALDEALCFGWIDGVRKRRDESSYTIRFSPRKARSKWSLVNVKRAKQLIKRNRMTAAGMKAYDARGDEKAIEYSYEARKGHTFSPAYRKQFQAKPGAWKYFNEQPPWYRRVVTFWVMGAKKEETQQKRLATLIDQSARGEWLADFYKYGTKKK